MAQSIKEIIYDALRHPSDDVRMTDAEYDVAMMFMRVVPDTIEGAEEQRRNDMQYRALGNITPLLTYLQGNASTLLPDALPGAYLLEELIKVLPALVTDAMRMRGLRLIVCESDMNMKVKMLDAVAGHLNTQPDVVADEKPTIERLNEVIDAILSVAHQARQS